MTHPVTDLLHWCSSGVARTYGSAVHIAIRLLRPDEPQTVEYLAANAREIIDRHPTALMSSKQSYAARVRTACQLYLGPSPSPQPSRRGLTAEEQISEALLGMSRWPALQRQLLPALLRAMDDMASSGEASLRKFVAGLGAPPGNDEPLSGETLAVLFPPAEEETA